MNSSFTCLLTCCIVLLYSSKTCTGDIPGPSLVLYIPNEPDYTDVLVRRIGDNLTLVCELRGDKSIRHYVWNYMPADGTTDDRSYTVTPALASSSNLTRVDLQEHHSGTYMCSAPPFSIKKYILVQGPGPKYCGRGIYWCGSRCMAPHYVCDGRKDCIHGEDELPELCGGTNICSRSDKLNCTSGRCISESACCTTHSVLCKQPDCCDDYPTYSRAQAGYDEVQFSPPLFDDRHAPDDYGFIQSTIYTVTACALIFMIAAVLLVSALCKMHMKRAALRSYARADRATGQHYTQHYAQTHRFPPCYEASRLLEQDGRLAVSPPHSPLRTTDLTLQCVDTPGTEPTTDERPAGLARLSAIFSSRYRQVPTQSDVELTNVRSTSLNNSPTRNRTLDNYRSPTYCDLNTPEFFFSNPETADFGRDLNFMDNREDRQRLTLQLGRFQLTIPRFGRRDSDRRPDTPNVAEINIDDLDFVRMSDTYTLNGRTIRLLGANFENYPLDSATIPPPYNEAMRYKYFGPPPEYLSREGLNSRADQEARSNVEMPPGYDELAGNSNTGMNNDTNNGNNTGTNNGINVSNGNNTGTSNDTSASTVNRSDNGINTGTNINVVDSGIDTGNNNSTEAKALDTNIDTLIDNTTVNNDTNNGNEISTSVRDRSLADNDNNMNNNGLPVTPVITVTESDNNNETISSVINNLPAIDSDVNANDNVINC